MNKDEDGDSGAGALGPPPKTSDMGFRASTMERVPQPPLPSAQNEDVPAMDISKLPTGSNMFKLPKGRSMRANYVDIMNPNGKSKGSAAPSNVATPMTSPLVPMATSSPQMFIPAPSKPSRFETLIHLDFIHASLVLSLSLYIRKCDLEQGCAVDFRITSTWITYVLST